MYQIYLFIYGLHIFCLTFISTNENIKLLRINDYRTVCDIKVCSTNLDRSSPFVSNGDNFCNCDRDCLIYGDCCLDIYDRVDNRSTSDNRSSLVCTLLFEQSSKKNIYMRSTCAEDWQEETTARVCQGKIIVTEDPLASLPVISSERSLLYKNIFCAICNNEKLENLKTWETSVDCSFNITYSNLEKTFNSTSDSRNLQNNKTETPAACIIKTSPPKNLMNFTRNCKKTIAECHENWSDFKIKKICDSFTSIMYAINTDGVIQSYKNEFCAMCNFVKPNNIICNYNQLDKSGLDEIDLNNFTFEVFISASNVGRNNNLRCKSGEILDPFKSKCRSLYCPETYEYLNETCVALVEVKQEETNVYVSLLLERDSMMESKDSNHYDGHRESKIYSCEGATSDSVIKCQQIPSRDVYMEFLLDNGIHVTDKVNLSSSKQMVIHPGRVMSPFCKKFFLEPSQFKALMNDYILWPAYNRIYGAGEYEYDEKMRALICAPVGIVPSSNSSCWQYTLEKWAYEKLANDTVYVELFDAHYSSDEYFIDVESRAHIKCVIGRFISNIENQTNRITFHLSQASYRINRHSLYIPSLNRSYSKLYYRINHYNRAILNFALETTNTNLINCSKYIKFPKEHYTVKNKGIYVRSLYISPEDYYMDGNVAYVCNRALPFDTLEFFKFPNNKGYKMIISLIALCLSCFCLILHIFAYIFVPAMRNLPGKIILMLVVSLLVTIGLFLIIGLIENIANYAPQACYVLRLMLHFFFLAFFIWMSVIAFDLWRSLTSCQVIKFYLTDEQKKWRFNSYFWFAWGIPLCIVTIVFIVDKALPENDFQSHYGRDGQCWFTNKKALLTFFFIPLTVTLLTNIVFFFLTVIYIIRVTWSIRRFRVPGAKRFYVYFRIAIIMGLGWTTAIIAKFSHCEIMEYIFILANAPQGVYIFLCCTCVRPVIHEIKRKMLTCQSPSHNPSSWQNSNENTDSSTLDENSDSNINTNSENNDTSSNNTNDNRVEKFEQNHNFDKIENDKNTTIPDPRYIILPLSISQQNCKE